MLARLNPGDEQEREDEKAGPGHAVDDPNRPLNQPAFHGTTVTQRDGLVNTLQAHEDK